jgi:hypothetical protein
VRDAQAEGIGSAPQLLARSVRQQLENEIVRADFDRATAWSVCIGATFPTDAF